MTTLRTRVAVVGLLVGALSGCAVAGPPDYIPRQIISPIWAPPAGVLELASEVRANGGMVVVAETVSMSEVETTTTETGYTGAWLAVDQAVFTVRVTDSLGEAAPLGTLLQVEARVSSAEVVDASGSPHTDWVVSGGAPLAVQLPPSSGSYVLFAMHTPRDTERARWVAALNTTMVDGELMRDPTDQAIESLRR